MKFVLCRCTACNGLFCQTKKKKRLGKPHDNMSIDSAEEFLSTSNEVFVIAKTNANKADQQK